jgi:hypothetical protein
MINPLLGDADQRCPTGWHMLDIPKAGYQGYSGVSLAAANVLRVREGKVVARLYHPEGDVAGLFCDDTSCVMLDRVGRRGKLMADGPGVHLLKARLPWSKHPVELPEDAPLRAMGVQHYPFSVLTHVVVTRSMPSDVQWAMTRAYTSEAMTRFGGLPVLGCPDGDISGLERVRWPDGVTVFAAVPGGPSRCEEWADELAELLFEVEVEPWSG